MTAKTFTLSREPHVATVGEHTLTFLSELYGTELLDGHARLTTKQGELKGRTDAAAAKELLHAVREFLASLMTPECAAEFLAIDTITRTSALDGVVVTETTYRIPLPQRVLTELMEWIITVHTGGEDVRPPT